MNDRNDDGALVAFGADCFKVEIKTNTEKFTNMIIARFVRESKVFIKRKTKVASRA